MNCWNEKLRSAAYLYTRHHHVYNLHGTGNSKSQVYLHSLVHTSPCFLNIHLYLKKEDSNFDSHNTIFFDFKGDSNMYRSSHPRCSVKKVLLKILHISQEITWMGVSFLAFRPATLLKRDSNIGVFLWILRNF